MAYGGGKAMYSTIWLNKNMFVKSSFISMSQDEYMTILVDGIIQGNGS